MTIEQSLVGAFLGLIVIVVVAAMFFSTEYRRGLIRTTLAATPRRGAVLAAKAVVIGAVAFGTGLVAAAVSIIVGVPREENQGQVLLTASALTEVRVIVGTAAMLAVAAILAVALGAILRRSAAAITIAVLVVVMPFLLTALNVVPGRRRRVAAAADPGRGPGDRAEHPAVRAGHRPSRRRCRATIRCRPTPGSPCCACGRRRPSPSRWSCCGGGTHERALGRRRADRRGARRRASDDRASPADAAVAPAAAPGASLARALHAEWTKLRTVSGPAWLLLGVAVLTIAVSAAAVGATNCPRTWPARSTRSSSA